MRVLIKVLLVLAAAAAVTAFGGRAVTGRFPSLRTIAAGAVVGTLAVLAVDLFAGW